MRGDVENSKAQATQASANATTLETQPEEEAAKPVSVHHVATRIHRNTMEPNLVMEVRTSSPTSLTDCTEGIALRITCALT
jgi:cytoskeletal protein RodZ